MTPVNFEEKNYTFGPPQGVSEEDCGSMPCYRGKEDGTNWPIIISAWKATPEELAEINRTSIVWLRNYSTGMNPVSISGHHPFKETSKPIEDPSSGVISNGIAMENHPGMKESETKN